MDVRQITVFLENKPGTLRAMTSVLAENGIDMRALSLAETKDFGIARIIVDDVYETTTVLKDAGFVNIVTPVVAVAIPDEPGGLDRVLRLFADEGINVEYMYAFLGGKNANHAYMIFRVQDVKAAENVLTADGVSVVGQDEIADL